MLKNDVRDFATGNKKHTGRNLAFGKEQVVFLPSAVLIFFILNQNHEANPAQSRWNMETSVKSTGQRDLVTQRLATGVSLLGSGRREKFPLAVHKPTEDLMPLSAFRTLPYGGWAMTEPQNEIYHYYVCPSGLRVVGLSRSVFKALLIRLVLLR